MREDHIIPVRESLDFGIESKVSSESVLFGQKDSTANQIGRVERILYIIEIVIQIDEGELFVDAGVALVCSGAVAEDGEVALVGMDGLGSNVYVAEVEVLGEGGDVLWLGGED